MKLESGHIDLHGPVWGLANAGSYGWSVAGGSVAVGLAANFNQLAGVYATQNTRIGTTTKAYGALPFAEAATLSGIVLPS